MVKNLSVNAGDVGSIPGLGRFLRLWSNEARAPQLLSSSAASTEAPVLRTQVLQQARPLLTVATETCTVINKSHKQVNNFFKILNFITPGKIPNKFIITGSGNQDMDIFLRQQLNPLYFLSALLPLSRQGPEISR